MSFQKVNLCHPPIIMDRLDEWEYVVSPTVVLPTVILTTSFHLLCRFAYCHFVYYVSPNARARTTSAHMEVRLG